MPTISNTLGALGSVGSYAPSSLHNTWSSVSTTGPAGVTGSYILNIASSWPKYETIIESDVIIKRQGKTDLHVAKTLEALMERLSVIEPNLELMEKYPALREAYENYRVMEALLLGGNNEDENE